MLVAEIKDESGEGWKRITLERRRAEIGQSTVKRQKLRERVWRCPECHGPVLAVLALKKVWHFRHHSPKENCALRGGEGESELHRHLKFALAGALERHYEEGIADFELRLAGLSRIADVLLELPRAGFTVAGEVQLSPLSLETLQQRTRDYLGAEVEPVWCFQKDAIELGFREHYRWLLEQGCLVILAQTQVTVHEFELP